MKAIDFIIALFCRVNDAMQVIGKQPQANLHSSKIITLAL
jgi:hypothetical protein